MSTCEEISPDSLGEVRIYARALVMVIAEPGSSGAACRKTVQTLFDFKCIKELLEKDKVVICYIDSGTALHKSFIEIYAVNTFPVLIVIGLGHRKDGKCIVGPVAPKFGHPTGLIMIHQDCETYLAVLLRVAIRNAVYDYDETIYWPFCFPEVVMTRDVGVNTSEKFVVEQYKFDSTVVTCKGFGYNQRDVAVQYNIYNEESMLSQEMDQLLRTEIRVWSIDRTSPLPIQATSRLQILLPSHSPVHVAASSEATMMDVIKFISCVLKTPSNCLEISRRYPRHVFCGSDNPRKLHELDLVPSAVLLVKIKTELVRPNWRFVDVVHNIITTVTKPFWGLLSGLWTQIQSIQSIFYSSSEDEEEADEDEDSSAYSREKHQSNVRTLFQYKGYDYKNGGGRRRDDENDDDNDNYDDANDDNDDDDNDDCDGRDRVPNYNGNSTQLL